LAKDAELRRHYLGVLGVQEVVEPVIDNEDRPLYEKIFPFFQNDAKRAIEMIKAGVRANSSAVFDYLLGYLQLQEGHADEAIRHFEQAIQKHPRFLRAQRGLSITLMQQQKWTEAIPHLLQVITLGGADGQSYGLLAYARLNEEAYSAALAAYRQARMFEPYDIQYKRGEVQCLLKVGAYAEARQNLEEMLGETPYDASLWMLQCNALLALGQSERALQNLQTLHDMGLATHESLVLLGNLYFNAGRVTIACDRYMEAEKMESFQEYGVIVQGIKMLMRMGEMDLAERLMVSMEQHKSVDQQPQVLTDLKYAKILLAFHRGEEKMSELENFVASNPLHGEAILTLAKKYRTLERNDEARFYLNLAEKLPEVKVEAWMELSRLALAARDNKEALRYLYKAEQSNPSETLRRYIDEVKALGR